MILSEFENLKPDWSSDGKMESKEQLGFIQRHIRLCLHLSLEYLSSSDPNVSLEQLNTYEPRLKKSQNWILGKTDQIPYNPTCNTR